jgi:hypothetical protein
MCFVVGEKMGDLGIHSQIYSISLFFESRFIGQEKIIKNQPG